MNGYREPGYPQALIEAARSFWGNPCPASFAILREQMAALEPPREPIEVYAAVGAMFGGAIVGAIKASKPRPAPRPPPAGPKRMRG